MDALPGSGCGDRQLFGRGAQVGIGQPNVSRHIGSLERMLGTRLLNRSTRQLTVTPDGQRYYELARQAMDVINQAESEARGQQNPHGLLRVACAPTLAVEQIVDSLPEFMARFPDVEVEFRLSDSFADLIAEGVDVAIRGGALKDSALRARRVGTSERVCIAGAAYLEQHGVPSQPADLLQHQCIIYTLLAEEGRGWAFTNGEVHVTGRLKLNSLEGVRRAALANMGIGYLPAWMVAHELRSGKLQLVLGDHAKKSPVNAVYSADRLLPLRATVFIDFIAALFAATPGLDGLPLSRTPD